jgi:PAS domain-containing protein
MPLQAVTFPRSDRVFARFVADVLAAGQAKADQPELERRLRSVYPRAVIRAREALGGYDLETVWYVYRDGRPLTRAAANWWTEPGVAEATFAEGGPYLTANDAMCALHGLPPGGLVGRRWVEFATSAAVVEAKTLWQRLRSDWPSSGGAIQSTFTIVRADGRLQPVEYHTVPEGDGTFRTWQRPLGEAEEQIGPPDEPTVRVATPSPG